MKIKKECSIIQGFHKSVHQKDLIFCEEIIKLVTGKKSGHLAPYHYGEPNYIYDPVNGSALWDRLVKNTTNYYQFHTENSIIPKVAEYIADFAGNKLVSLIDLGPGSDTSLHTKTFPFLSSLRQIENYIPVDISAEYLKKIITEINTHYPYLKISSQQKNYFEHSINYNINSVPIFLFLSSSISNLPEINLSGSYRRHLKLILSHFHNCMHGHGYFIVSQDSNRDEPSLLNAYRDSLHVDFSLNVLHRIKRDALDIDNNNFNPEEWVYKPEWFPDKSLLAHSVYNTTDQQMSILGKKYFIPCRTQLVLDNSYKYKITDFLKICEESGFTPIKTFMDNSNRIAIHILKN